MPCDLLKLERWTTNSTQHVSHCFSIFFHPTPQVLSSDWWNVKFAHIKWLKSSVLHRNRGGSCSVKILRNNLCYSSSKYYVLIVFQITVSVCSQWMNSGSSCLRKEMRFPVFRSCRSGETSYRFLEGFLLQQPTSSSLVWRFPLIGYLYFSPSCKSWQFANLIYLIRASIAIISFCLMEVWRAIILSVVALGGAFLPTGLISWTEEKKRVTNLLPCPGLAFLLTIVTMLATRASVGSLVKGGSFS